MNDHILDAITGKSFCGACYEGKVGRATQAGHFGHRAAPNRRRLFVADYVRKRVTAAAGETPSDPRADASDWAVYYPAIAEYMTLSVLDGAPRSTMTVLVFVESGSWKCRVLDREEDVQAFITARSLTQLMDLVEAGLIAGTLDWRKVQPFGKKK